ncbi:MAG: hypothetical protein RR911_03715 [Oscillospiraceae bacterium]
MKARDKQKLYGTLTLLASIAVAIGTALSITYVALGFLVIYVRDNFSEWNEKRKAENAANKAMGIKKEPGLLATLKAKKKAKKAKEKAAKKNNAKTVTTPITGGIPVKPVEFNTIQKPVVEEKKPVYKPEPVVLSQPIVTPQPVVKPQPIVTPQPVVKPQPIVTPQPVVETNNITSPKVIVSEGQIKIAMPPMVHDADSDDDDDFRAGSRFKGIKF